MTTLSIPERRRLERTALKKPASLIVDLGELKERIPCLIIDYSYHGFKIRGTVRVKRGQAVELILEDYSLNAVLCNVMWVGKPGSKQEGEAGLQAVIR